MTATLTVKLPPLHPGQQAVAHDPARFKVLACGRRWGKTRLGTVLCLATALRGGRAWWVAPTYKMAQVGWRGLQQLAQQIPNTIINLSERSVAVASSGTVQVRSADNPTGLRSEGLNFCVLDECAYIQEVAWTESLRPALADRKGGALFISTPHGLNWFRDLFLRGQGNDLEWRSWQFKSIDNPFLDPREIESARQLLTSRIFRQEFEADFLEDAPGALWKRAWLDAGRTVQMPELRRIVVGVDPSATATGDECGIVAAGIDRTGAVYVLDDSTVSGGPERWARAVASLYHKLKADVVIAEANNGGEMVRLTLNSVDQSLPVRLVHASRGKVARAEPVAVLYEQGRVHHVGEFPRLEGELCQWEDDGKHPSPNRLDALVWAVSALTAGVGWARGGA